MSRALLASFALASLTLPSWSLAQDETLSIAAPDESAVVAPDVSSYAGIDAALEGRVVLAGDAPWRYLPSTEQLFEKFEWGAEDFDDASWAIGRAPFGFGAEYADLGTEVPPVPSMLLRRTLKLDDRTNYAEVLFELAVDDGYILFVNGREEDRLHADSTDKFLAFDATTTAERTVDTPPLPVVVMTPMLRDGRNTFALQVLTHSTDRDSLAVYPRVRVVFTVTPEGEQARLGELRALLESDGGDNAARLAYLQGRHHLRLEQFADAVAPLTRAAELDPEATEPWLALAAAHRGAGTLAALDAALLEHFQGGAHARAMLDAWSRVALDDLGLSCVDFTRRVSNHATDDALLPTHGDFANALWSGHALAAGESLRIECGAPDDDGGTPRDRAFGEGTRAFVSEAGSVRICSRSLELLVPAYRVPVAPGAYAVTLHWAASDGTAREAGDAPFDVMLEDARVARGVDPVATDGGAALPVPLYVHDGFLDLDLLPQRTVDPWIAAIDIEPLSDAAFLTEATDWAARTERKEAFPLAQAAAANALGGDRRAAFALLEEAEKLVDFGPTERASLGELRDELLPEVLSLATVDDLVVRRASEAAAILEQVKQAGKSDHIVPYFEGRIAQLAGHIDEAMIGFEQVAFGDTDDPRAMQRMIECLAGTLPEDAFGLLAGALEDGLERSDALLQLWISLQIGPLGRDPWDLIGELATMDVPDELVVLPTSEFAAREWNFTRYEPPANAWSRASFDDSSWWKGYGMFGSGHTPYGTARSFANNDKFFGRKAFTLADGALLFPYFDVLANDAGECYLNGTLVSRVSVAVSDYTLMPVRPANFNKGVNILGEFGFNVRDSGIVDVGITQPLADLIWIHEKLESDGAIRINCGGGDYVAANGTEWSADRFFGWARAYSAPNAEVDIAGTDDDALYRTQRWFYDDSTGAFHQIPLPNGKYHVTLHFAEIHPSYAEAGKRKFDVRLENELVLDDFDPVAEAGFETAIVREFDVDVVDGWFDLLVNDKELRSFVSAFEIVGGR